MKLIHPLILASNSPRRKQLLQEAGFQFKVVVIPSDEVIPKNILPVDVALYLARVKSGVHSSLAEEAIVITADTIVLQESDVLGKPITKKHAMDLLEQLSGHSHEVITAVVIRHQQWAEEITSITKVTFKNLAPSEINYYVDNFSPYDKAGGYGIQEWIGLIGISEIEGSYYNVVGLPIDKVYTVLQQFKA